ncbi:MAG: hypothetical protein K2W99_02535 [Chthoniobacterales bacterium]|nr:hypothetical protein [Chthoniobacterales bacterium]
MLEATDDHSTARKTKSLSKKENKVIQRSYLELEELDENDPLVEEPPAWH